MGVNLRAWLGRTISDWLVQERQSGGTPLCDYDRLSYEIRPGDVILVEGRSRVSDVIRIITQSPWSHAALYIGRMHDIDDQHRRALMSGHTREPPGEQLVIETILGKGTIVSPLSRYRHDHLRICRPRGLSRQDAQKVIGYAIDSLGSGYDVRQLLDLARFIFPYSFLPRRWRSTLFDHHAGIPTRTVCSTQIASAFMSVRFPILPVIRHQENGELNLYQRNPRRFTPRDFDYSPYFDIIKYPIIDLEAHGLYQQLPWNEDGIVCNDENDCFVPVAAAASRPADAAMEIVNINLLGGAVRREEM